MLKMKRVLPSSYTVTERKKKRWRMQDRVQEATLADLNFVFDDDSDPLSAADVVTDTQAAMLYLKSLFPKDRCLYRVPVIILKHQLYSIVEDKTEVDRQLNLMQDAGEIQLFKFFLGSDEFAVVFMAEYKDHIINYTRNKSADIQSNVNNFINDILPKIKDVSLDRETIDKFEMTEEMITALMNAGVLIHRDVGTWWISIPDVAQYMKHLCDGRKAILNIIKKQKYKEILERELETRTLNPHSKLGISYHLHDVIGAEMIKKVKSTSGNLLRLANLHSSKSKKRKPF